MNADFQHSRGAPTVWALTDNRAGNAGQCLGVAEALGLRFETRDIDYTAKAALPNFIMGASFGGLTPSSRVNLVPPWPDILITAGRRTAPVARRIKENNDGRTFLVQIMHPGDAGIDDFDLIAVPTHDGVTPRPNFLEITGAPHRVTAAVLAEAEEAWRDTFAKLPEPRIALIVGGSTRRRTFTDDMARALGQLATTLARDNAGSLLISTSRRTGAAADALFADIRVPYFAFRWGDEGENPYFGFLGSADAVIVTGDSVSMCSEACAVPVPVYVYAPPKLTTRKHARLHQSLFDGGYARPLESLNESGKLENWEHPPLNAATAIAAEIKKRFGL